MTKLTSLRLKDTADQILSLKAQALIAFKSKSSNHDDCTEELMSAIDSFRKKGEKMFSINHDAPAFQKPEHVKKQGCQTKESLGNNAAPVEESGENDGLGGQPIM